jgi:hypothetical protein
LTGARVDYRNDSDSGLIALFLSLKVGYQSNGVSKAKVFSYGMEIVTGDYGRSNKGAGLFILGDRQQRLRYDKMEKTSGR